MALLASYAIISLFILILLIQPVRDAFSEMFSNIIGHNAEIIIVFFFMLVFFITFSAVILIKYVVDEKNDSGSDYSKMDAERSYLENEINKLNEKLVSTDKRWNEVYHLILSSQRREQKYSSDVSNNSFLSGFGIDSEKIKVQKDLAFVLTPFHDNYNQTYSVISNACRKAKMRAMRGDEEYVSTDILKHIINYIACSRIIIANIDGRNPNVFYELGLAQALGKPTILVAHKNLDLPFDVQGQYCVFYSDNAEIEEKLFDAILKILASGV